jgi:ribosomal protein S18 acetylase RimI-like enzyme
MQVRLLGRGEYAAVLQAAHLFDEPPDALAVRDYLEDPRNLFWISYADGKPVGFLRGTSLGQLKARRKQFFLYEIAVEESRRRQGIGTALVSALLRHCREGGYEEVFVFTDDPKNVPAEKLYRSTGAVTETAGDRMYVYRLSGTNRARTKSSLV